MSMSHIKTFCMKRTHAHSSLKAAVARTTHAAAVLLLASAAAPAATAEAQCSPAGQSAPINIERTEPVIAHALELRYAPAPFKATLSETGLVFPYSEGGQLKVGDQTYSLSKIVLKTPGEHAIAGQTFAAEIQLYHTGARGTAIVAVPVLEGASHPAIEEIWPLLPLEIGQTNAPTNIKYNARDLLPFEADYYRYQGTSTVSPCAVPAAWFVLKKPVSMSQSQLSAAMAIQGATATPRAERGDRLILDVQPQ